MKYNIQFAMWGLESMMIDTQVPTETTSEGFHSIPNRIDPNTYFSRLVLRKMSKIECGSVLCE